MVVIMQNGATQADLDAVMARVEGFKLRGSITVGESQNIIGIVGTPIPTQLQEMLESMSGVREVVRISRPYKPIQARYAGVPPTRHHRRREWGLGGRWIGSGHGRPMCRRVRDADYDGGTCHQKSRRTHATWWGIQTTVVAV